MFYSVSEDEFNLSASFVEPYTRLCRSAGVKQQFASISEDRKDL